MLGISLEGVLLCPWAQRALTDRSHELERGRGDGAPPADRPFREACGGTGRGQARGRVARAGGWQAGPCALPRTAASWAALTLGHRAQRVHQGVVLWLVQVSQVHHLQRYGGCGGWSSPGDQGSHITSRRRRVAAQARTREGGRADHMLQRPHGMRAYQDAHDKAEQRAHCFEPPKLAAAGRRR